MKKKVFKTKNNWIYIDLIVALIIIVASLIIARDHLNELITALINREITIGQFIPILLIFLTISMPFSIPGVAIYLIIRFNIKKNNRKNATFKVVNDIEYYRNDFGEISPALISLMANLDIENKKDISAMLLYYKLNKIIRVSDNKIEINESAVLKESDKSFFKWIESRNEFNLIEWKNKVKEEGIEQGYIQKKKDSNKGCLIPIIGLILTSIAITFGWLLLTKIIENNNEQIKIMYLFVILFVLLFLIFNFVWIGLAYFISDKLSKKNIKRTKKGNELTEKIYAMKNFIHDFSNLSQATKESLCMWEYFLIYAVVLEENETVLEEIKGYYDIDSLKILLSEENLVDKKIYT